MATRKDTGSSKDPTANRTNQIVINVIEESRSLQIKVKINTNSLNRSFITSKPSLSAEMLLAIFNNCFLVSFLGQLIFLFGSKQQWPVLVMEGL